MHNPNEMRPVIHRLDRKSVPQNIQDLRVGAMGFQSGMFYIYKGQVGLLANNYMEKGWRKQDYAAIIRPENYCKLLPQCFVCSGKDDFLKAQTKQFVKLLNADGRHFQYVFSDAKGADHAYAALHPETEWGEMANDDMLAFFDRCKR
jgi:acetyl esterase/lipase